MPKTIKEIQQDYTGNTTVEYSDGSTRTYSVDDVPVVQSNPFTGGDALLVGGNRYPLGPIRYVGYENEQPSGVTQAVTKYGKLACRFGSGQWTVSGGAPTLTQGYTGWDASGNKTGITPRTGQPDMLKVVPAANSAEEIGLGTFGTNMLTPLLSGKFGLWAYIENVPGYETGGGSGQINLTLSTNAASGSNGLYIQFTSQQIKEGWNFLKFVMRDSAAYVPASGVTEYHPFGVSATAYGTGADANILSAPVARLRLGWGNLLGATLYFDSIWTDFDSTPQIVLGCDGGINTVEFALPVFESNGWVGYTAFPYRVWSSGSKDIANLNSNVSPVGAAVYAKGWDFINHTANHTNNGLLTSASEIAYEMEIAKAWQFAIDMPRGAEFYASPQSSTSRLSEKVIKALGYKLQRHSRKWNVCVTPWGLENPHNLGSVDMGSLVGAGIGLVASGAPSTIAGANLASKIIRMVDVTVAYGDTLFPFWHGITTTGDSGSGEDSTGDSLLVTKSAFEKVCAYIRVLELQNRLKVCRGVTGFYYGE